MNKKYRLIVLLGILFFITLLVYNIPNRYSNVQEDDEPLITTTDSFEGSFNMEITPISLSNTNEDRLKIILINLEKRRDRLSHFVNLFNNSDLQSNSDLYRIDAVDGKKHINDIIPVLSDNALDEFKIYKKIKKRVGHHSLTEGGMGCYMSHILALKHVKNFGVPCVVAEDDVSIPENTYGNLYTFVKKIERIPKTKPYIILFHSICSNSMWDKLECTPVTDDIYSAKQFWSTAFYYITPEAAEVLLEFAFPIKYQIDHMMSTMNQKGLIDIYFIKNIVKTSFNDTDIQVPLI
jgi:GR25 family glycosyltransferase involved in LPS biosynthesis